MGKIKPAEMPRMFKAEKSDVTGYLEGLFSSGTVVKNNFQVLIIYLEEGSV